MPYTPFVSKVHPGGPSRLSVHGPPHGPIWLTFETIGARKPRRLFQKSIPAAHHGRPSTACPHGPLWQTSETIGVRNPCRLFQKSISAARHGRPSTACPHGPLWRTSETIVVRNPCRSFQKFTPAARHGQPSSGPSRTSVTARSHELLKQTAPHTAGSYGRLQCTM